MIECEGVKEGVWDRKRKRVRERERERERSNTKLKKSERPQRV